MTHIINLGLRESIRRVDESTYYNPTIIPISDGFISRCQYCGWTVYLNLNKMTGQELPDWYHYVSMDESCRDLTLDGEDRASIAEPIRYVIQELEL